MVKIVELELNIDVNDDINAAIIQANVKPRIANKKKTENRKWWLDLIKQNHSASIESPKVDMLYHYSRFYYDKRDNMYPDQYIQFRLNK